MPHSRISRKPVKIDAAQTIAAPQSVTPWLNEEPMTPAEVLDRFKIKYGKNPNKKVYELTRRRGNRPPMPSHRVGKELRFFWSEVRQWLHETQQLRAAA